GRALHPTPPPTLSSHPARPPDGAGTPAPSPDPPAAPASFTTPAAAPTTCAHDQVAADFSAGTLTNTIVTTTADGEVTLAPTLNVDFSGNALPAGWASWDWQFDPPVGTSTVAGGLLTVDGARANPEPFAAGPGSTLEFVATFSGAQSQHVGFGAGNHVPPNEVYDTTPWAIFSTAGGGPLLARTNAGGAGSSDVVIPGNFIGAPHLYRIEWGAANVKYSIDGALVRTDAFAITDPMRPAVSDIFQGGGVVTVDWMRMTPYVASGTFESRVFDAG